MKWYGYILGPLLVLLFSVGAFFTGRLTAPKPVTRFQTDTVVRYCESVRYVPREVTRRIVEKVPIYVRDTVSIQDTVYVELESAMYEDTLYTAWVSGYMPRLDSIEIRSKIITVTESIPVEVTRKPKLSVGLCTGIGVTYGLIGKQLDAGPFCGVGITYNF